MDPNDVFTTLFPLNRVYEAVSPSMCKQLTQPCNTDWCCARFPIRKTTDLQQFVFSGTVGSLLKLRSTRLLTDSCWRTCMRKYLSCTTSCHILRGVILGSHDLITWKSLFVKNILFDTDKTVLSDGTAALLSRSILVYIAKVFF